MQTETQTEPKKKVLFKHHEKEIFLVEQNPEIILPNGKVKKKSLYQMASTFTLLIYFKQGYTAGSYTHSWKHERRTVAGLEIMDNRYCFNRLTNLVENTWKGKYKTAYLVHNPSDVAVITWAYDTLKEKLAFDFPIAKNGDIIFTFKNRVVNNPQLHVANHVPEMNYKY